MELTFELRLVVKKQMCKDIGTTCDRWVNGLSLMNRSENIDHLWVNASFREAYMDAIDIRDFLFQAISGNETHEDKHELIEKIVDQIDYDGEEGFEKLLEGAQKVLGEVESNDAIYNTEHHNLFIEDLKLIVVFSRLATQCLKLTRQVEQELTVSSH